MHHVCRGREAVVTGRTRETAGVREASGMMGKDFFCLFIWGCHMKHWYTYHMLREG